MLLKKLNLDECSDNLFEANPCCEILENLICKIVCIILKELKSKRNNNLKKNFQNE